MMRRTRFVTLAAMVALATMAAPAAHAQTEAPTERHRTVEEIQEWAVGQIERRLETIDRLSDAVTDHPHVSGAHRGALLGELGSHRGGLSALRAEIERTGEREELARLVPTIATDFRIYLVVVPKVVGVLHSDTVVAFGERAEEGMADLEVWIERAEDAGIDTTEAQEHLGDMRDEVAGAVAVGGPVADALLPLEAGDWPDPAAGVIEGAVSDLRGARDLARTAIESAHQVIEALREARGTAA